MRGNGSFTKGIRSVLAEGITGRDAAPPPLARGAARVVVVGRVQGEGVEDDVPPLPLGLTCASLRVRAQTNGVQVQKHVNGRAVGSTPNGKSREKEKDKDKGLIRRISSASSSSFVAASALAGYRRTAASPASASTPDMRRSGKLERLRSTHDDEDEGDEDEDEGRPSGLGRAASLSLSRSRSGSGSTSSSLTPSGDGDELMRRVKMPTKDGGGARHAEDAEDDIRPRLPSAASPSGVGGGRALCVVPAAPRAPPRARRAPAHAARAAPPPPRRPPLPFLPSHSPTSPLSALSTHTGNDTSRAQSHVSTARTQTGLPASERTFPLRERVRGRALVAACVRALAGADFFGGPICDGAGCGGAGGLSMGGEAWRKDALERSLRAPHLARYARAVVCVRGDQRGAGAGGWSLNYAPLHGLLPSHFFLPARPPSHPPFIHSLHHLTTLPTSSAPSSVTAPPRSPFLGPARSPPRPFWVLYSASICPFFLSPRRKCTHSCAFITACSFPRGVHTPSFTIPPRLQLSPPPHIHHRLLPLHVRPPFCVPPSSSFAYPPRPSPLFPSFLRALPPRIAPPPDRTPTPIYISNPSSLLHTLLLPRTRFFHGCSSLTLPRLVLRYQIPFPSIHHPRSIHLPALCTLTIFPALTPRPPPLSLPLPPSSSSPSPPEMRAPLEPRALNTRALLAFLRAHPALERLAVLGAEDADDADDTDADDEKSKEIDAEKDGENAFLPRLTHLHAPPALAARILPRLTRAAPRPPPPPPPPDRPANNNANAANTNGAHKGLSAAAVALRVPRVAVAPPMYEAGAGAGGGRVGRAVGGVLARASGNREGREEEGKGDVLALHVLFGPRVERRTIEKVLRTLGAGVGEGLAAQNTATTDGTRITKGAAGLTLLEVRSTVRAAELY
ncbi:hypothetical protein DFH09DRAFT_1507734 [Mycena vulgaris]|nr:hypothetical protein DFH09DRAFT_1507734 [Mycena vulgaris]